MTLFPSPLPDRMWRRLEIRRRSMDRIQWLGGALVALLITLAVVSPAFAAGNQAGDIDQWANSANKWQNGDLNPANSHYREDYVVPYRAKLTGLTVGHSYTI